MQRRSRGVWRFLSVTAVITILAGVGYVMLALVHGLYVQEDLHPLVSNPPAPTLATIVRSPSVAPVAPGVTNTTVTTRLPSWTFLYRHPEDGEGAPPREELYGNRRAVVPLLLTSIRYHGTSLLAATLQGWILKFFIPQGNIDLVIFYDHTKVPIEELISVLRIKRRDATAGTISPTLLHNIELADDEARALGDGWFVSSFHPTFAFRLHPARIPFPDYLVSSNLTQLDDPRWMRCGCPPVCPEKRATVDYVQGTRWYTHDLFLEPIVRPYSFWIKLDVDIWMMRELRFNMVERLIEQGAVFAHTGMIYNGHGCSNELHKAIALYLQERGMSAVSDRERWWMQDDNVYYSNFVISSMAFHLSPEHMRLAKALNDYPTGFFKYRWTDQSLFHKVFGVFFGPTEEKFLLDWTNLRCSKKAYRKGAVFYHSKGKKKSSILRLCTDI